MEKYKTLNATLVHVIQESVRVKRFFFQVEKREEFVFVPGQNLVLSIPGVIDDSGRIIKRVFSIASCPTDEHIELCIAINPPPSFSSTIATLSQNSKVIIEGPFGQFVLASVKKKVTFIAAGTGIAPLMSMIRAFAKENLKSNRELFFGIRSSEDFLYKKELEEYQKSHGLRLIIAASRDGAWQGLQGHITQFLPSLLENNGQEVYVCGPPEMVRETLNVLALQGFLPHQIKKEQW